MSYSLSKEKLGSEQSKTNCTNSNQTPYSMKKKTTSNAYSESPDHVREYYFYLGQISILFANVEENIMAILGSLLNSNQVLIKIVLEGNGLEKNIQILKKVNQMQHFQEPQLTQLIQQIGTVKKVRNKFIHGIWSKPWVCQETNEATARCSANRIKYMENPKLTSGEQMVISKAWMSSTQEVYTLSYLIKITRQLEDIILSQEAMIKHVEEHPITDY